MKNNRTTYLNSGRGGAECRVVYTVKISIKMKWMSFRYMSKENYQQNYYKKCSRNVFRLTENEEKLIY